ncbi:hypothetical protein CR513_24400, partial [Mucuna pruriens]
IRVPPRALIKSRSSSLLSVKSYGIGDHQYRSLADIMITERFSWRIFCVQRNTGVWWKMGFLKQQKEYLLMYRESIDDQKLKNLKAKNYLFQALGGSVLETILNKDTTKDTWNSLKQKYQGTSRVKRAQLQALRKEFEILHMKEGESVNDYFARTLTIANKIKANGENKENVAIVEKILRSMTPKFDYVVCSIEESKDIDTLTIDELQSSLLVHEQRMTFHVEEEHALKVSHGDQYAQYAERGRGRGDFGWKGRGRGRQGFDKSIEECYNCHQLGHFSWECSNQRKVANYVETEEEMLLMAYTDMNKANEVVWFLDSRCSNHIYKDFVKLGNNSNMTATRKVLGNYKKKGLSILFQHGKCKVFHLENSLIMETRISSNRMSMLHAISQPPKSTCFHTVTEDIMHLWHCRYERLSFRIWTLEFSEEYGKWLAKNEGTNKTVQGLLGREATTRFIFPKKSTWRATQVLQLILADICRPIKPISNSKKSRKTWVYFLVEKSEAFLVFKNFKIHVEKEADSLIRGLRTNCRGEQLIAAYTPQLNEIVERKNRTIMNMVRSMLSEKKICHLVRACLELVVRNKTPEEAWNKVKPSVKYFRVFGCISYAHVPDNLRSKLDEKSLRCVLLGISDESKAYRLYDPISQRIIVSRDVKYEEVILCDLDWGDKDVEVVVEEENETRHELDHNTNTTEEDNISFDSMAEESTSSPNQRRCR